MFLLAAITKRAQFPFSAWLPAAIAAPTPIRALVHSSTLVTAGVYLIIRIGLRFKGFNDFSGLLLVISVFTVFFSGLRAVIDFDIKKIIALSTLSQLGVIIITLSTGFEILALFHLLTHALFKALLFLCAGAIIHGSINEQDIRGYFSLFYKMPLVVASFNLASLSLIGFPFLSGFYSKDIILEVLYSSNNSFVLFSMVVVSTFFTRVYSLRLFYFTVLKGLLSPSFSQKDLFIKEFNSPIIVISLRVVFMGGGLM